MSEQSPNDDFAHYRCPVCHYDMWVSADATGMTCDGGGKHRQAKMELVDETRKGDT